MFLKKMVVTVGYLNLWNTMKLETSIYHMIRCIQVFSTRQKNGPRSTRINHCNYMSQEHPSSDWFMAKVMAALISTWLFPPVVDMYKRPKERYHQHTGSMYHPPNDMSFTHSTKIARYNVKCFGYNWDLVWRHPKKIPRQLAIDSNPRIYPSMGFATKVTYFGSLKVKIIVTRCACWNSTGNVRVLHLPCERGRSIQKLLQPCQIKTHDASPVIEK